MGWRSRRSSFTRRITPTAIPARSERARRAAPLSSGPRLDRAPVDGGGGLRGAAAEPAWEYNVWRGVQEAVVRDWGGRDFEDIMAGVDELVRRGIADPERLY